MKIKFIILLIILTNLCFGQDGFKEFKADRYSLSYPANWRLDSSGTMNTKFILFSELKEKDTFNENINMVVQDLTSQQGFTMESYVKLSENQIKKHNI